MGKKKNERIRGLGFSDSRTIRSSAIAFAVGFKTGLQGVPIWAKHYCIYRKIHSCSYLICIVQAYLPTGYSRQGKNVHLGYASSVRMGQFLKSIRAFSVELWAHSISWDEPIILCGRGIPSFCRVKPETPVETKDLSGCGKSRTGLQVRHEA